MSPGRDQTQDGDTPAQRTDGSGHSSDHSLETGEEYEPTHCAYCGRLGSGHLSQRYCTGCGRNSEGQFEPPEARETERYCGHCGRKRDPNDNFCRGCGRVSARALANGTHAADQVSDARTDEPVGMLGEDGDRLQLEDRVPSIRWLADERERYCPRCGASRGIDRPNQPALHCQRCGRGFDNEHTERPWYLRHVHGVAVTIGQSIVIAGVVLGGIALMNWWSGAVSDGATTRPTRQSPAAVAVPSLTPLRPSPTPAPEATPSPRPTLVPPTASPTADPQDTPTPARA